MNYPIWDLPASGLLIAGVAIVHVFISHFAVGGGLFLVLLEWRARNTGHEPLLDYVRKHSQFFILLTLVGGAITGVGIWFTIGLVHPQATSTLIQTFVWVWAMEWTFFVTEIAAAMVYFYGWDYLGPKTHQRIGWIYLVSAWMSLFTINGILTFMLTPGDWIVTRSLLDGFFNPTFWPALVSRTMVAVGLAGLYALLTASWLKDVSLRETVARYASLRWVLPSMVVLPPALLWFLSAADDAGVPVSEVLGAAGGFWWNWLAAVFLRDPSSGYPMAQLGGFILLAASILIVIATLVVGVAMPKYLRPAVSIPLLVLGLLAFGGGEFVREDLRKPYVLGQIMFVNGALLPSESSSPGTGQDHETIASVYSLPGLSETGVLPVSRWTDPALRGPSPASGEEVSIERGREVFRLLCSTCHTTEGHLGITGLVAGQSSETIESVVARLAVPVSESGEDTDWAGLPRKIRSWRGRRMPPFAGSDLERQSLALYLDSLDGSLAGAAEVSLGQQVFERRCVFCHGNEADWAMVRLAPGRNAPEFYERIGRLPTISPIMPPFEGTEEDRLALSQYLAELVSVDSGKVQ
ncbi:MAG: cytochrome ubiquinol oxidase subunit I [Acidobacteriota bacterium]|nr:MAG: cytochrome ubiquinol oxidase subunit I [Acidobacteriota bacterium]